MKSKKNLRILYKYIGSLINSKKPYNRLENHQPSWMYRNE